MLNNELHEFSTLDNRAVLKKVVNQNRARQLSKVFWVMGSWSLIEALGASATERKIANKCIYAFVFHIA